MANETIGKTITVAVLVCLVCSVLVSTAAVRLKPRQERNKALSKKTNILRAAGLYKPGGNIDELFQKIETKYVDMESGEFDEEIDPSSYDFNKWLKDPGKTVAINADKDIAKIQKRLKTAEIYLVRDGDTLETIILPIYGKGLWSTMYAFLALEGDGITVKGYSFYDHGETPGLGGEVDNPLWQKQWVGKKIVDDNLNLVVEVLKGKVNLDRPEAIHQADGLAGATLTTVGIENLMRYWLGEEGFEKFLSNIRNTGVENG